MGFTGLKLEPHGVLDEQICIAYIDGKRVGVLYFHPQLHTLKVMHEADVALIVDRRTSKTTFERTMYE